MIKTTLAIALALATSTAALAQSADPALTPNQNQAVNTAIANTPTPGDNGIHGGAAATPANNSNDVAAVGANPAASPSGNSVATVSAGASGTATAQNSYPVCSRTVTDKCVNRGAYRGG